MSGRNDSRLHVVGVRHHSPACARLVVHTLETVRPRHVLIEGPVDMNPRLEELLLPHEPPLAVFSAWRDEERTQASWTPFCAYSPEWVALTRGHAAGAQVRFMDLPAWDKAFEGVRNRYSDGERRTARAIEALCQKLGLEGMDALWDHLFEQPLGMDVLAERLRVYFDSLRGEEEASERDTQREAFMLTHVEAALARDDGPVVVVCGGFHAPVLARAQARPGAGFPPVPSHPSAKSYLVPYSFRRLDSFAGYESGMPSPAFYQALWESGAEAAPGLLLREAVGRLRGRGQHVSSADLIAASVMAEGLARLRGHAVLSRTDLLDGLASALVKESLDVALPWTGRGVPSPDTHPLLAEVLRAFSGERTGRLSPLTPRPPLLTDVEHTLHAHGLTPGPSPRTVRLELREPGDVERGRVLHRLRVLGLPGFTRNSGPTFPTEPVLQESWTVAPAEDFLSWVIEASGWGATLEQAATARLEEALLQAGPNLERLTLLLAESFFIGAKHLARRVLTAVAAQAGNEPDLARLGAALERLLAIWRHDVLLGAQGSAEVGQLLAAAVERGLWLLEQLDGPSLPSDEGHLRAMAALRDTLRFAAQPLALDVARASAVFERRLASLHAPPAVRGASLGALWSLSRFPDEASAEAAALRATRAAARPSTLGDFLAGLFRLAREQVVHTPALTSVLDELIRQLTEEDFLVALPALRLAFGFFPPREKEGIARTLLPLHGQDASGARALVRLDMDPAVILAGAALDDEVEQVLERFGLHGPGRKEKRDAP
ncbi:hypothetical protein D187_002246 [Cystobacter fuscus DSM 2262]|uniref:Uncharacterized protein n=1 Tax=Cystobacter fuscus (strain ATCC 25194 / DSM 2262 / NBRC 100088 / M29) TaxID=1242864 RepID=S9P6V1_CYSF2|nr:DUF5682 family protein [Cystobacter fuscus]EPX60160.1 hypothetical protein D187_002246 [Cystobacter fuscus DSM 2262]